MLVTSPLTRPHVRLVAALFGIALLALSITPILISVTSLVTGIIDSYRATWYEPSTFALLVLAQRTLIEDWRMSAPLVFFWTPMCLVAVRLLRGTVPRWFVRLQGARRA